MPSRRELQQQWTAQLKSLEQHQRAEAAEALAQMGPDAAPAAIELVEACADVEAIQTWSVAALEELGPPPPDQIHGIAELAGDANPLVAYWAITLLGRAEADAAAYQDVLIDAVRSCESIAVRQRAAWALGKIGAASKESISENAKAALKTATQSSDPRLARLAQTSLEQCR
ncbi:HEAT repeat domain-containing protein [Novipirellula artificiosorum]|uniref:HEAT repeat protein n=1 Tax=Novipirellula artificiosorum TaxID=2528016 RepID=A0A5C6DRD6_9BACT|nr:HEAT repeat domain-containing protein [Novipirellula artificiosorum]TWU39212.1 hypothetical protein Poly41_20340 [Novipirellula artificiosorum]